MKIAMISDVHGKWNKIQIPECDLLISAGDYSFKGEKHMVEDFHKWLNKQEAGYVISVQGNHELWVEQNFEQAKDIAEKACPGVHFIGDGQAVNIEGFNIYGSAITPWFYNWAWNRTRGDVTGTHYFSGKVKSALPIKQEWDKIPDNTNILVTHGPPKGILDMVTFVDDTPKERVGCDDLMNRILQLPELKLHVFGHIHCGAGEHYFNGVKYVNASICDEQYMPTNPVRIIEL